MPLPSMKITAVSVRSMRLQRRDGRREEMWKTNSLNGGARRENLQRGAALRSHSGWPGGGLSAVIKMIWVHIIKLSLFPVSLDKLKAPAVIWQPFISHYES